MNDLDQIKFDESDKNLFQVDDAQLRADALKHSLLPRLQTLLNQSLALVREIYNIEVLEDSRISHYPQFKTIRKNQLSFLYDSAYVGVGGKSVKDKWLGVERKDKKIPQTLPFRFGFQITEEGIILLLESHWLKGSTDKSHRKFLEFCIKESDLISTLCFRAEMFPMLFFSEKTKFISTFKAHYQFMTKNNLFDNDFYSKFVKYPVDSWELKVFAEKFAYFFPVYDSYLQISMNKTVRFRHLIEKLNEWKLQKTELNNLEETLSESVKINEQKLIEIREIAEQKVKVMPALRWQVFQRDNWKCVSCGRSSNDNIILHVDHIIPRSKGGKNEISNYQTLCSICNIGKSNKDETNLRKKYNFSDE